MNSKAQGWEWIVSACLIVSTVGCSGGSDKPSAPLAPPRDTSLNEPEYLAKGLPAIDRAWGAVEYGRAAQVLGAIAAESPSQLPRYESERSGAVFSRITTMQNMTVIADQSLLLETRLAEAVAQLKSLGEIMRIYVSAHQTGVTDYAEPFEIMGALFRRVSQAIPLAEESASELTKSDPTYKARTKGREQLKSDIVFSIDGAITTLNDRNIPKPYRRRVLRYLAESIPPIASFLPSESLRVFALRLSDMDNAPPFDDFISDSQFLQMSFNRVLRTRGE